MMLLTDCLINESDYKGRRIAFSGVPGEMCFYYFKISKFKEIVSPFFVCKETELCFGTMIASTRCKI